MIYIRYLHFAVFGDMVLLVVLWPVDCFPARNHRLGRWVDLLAKFLTARLMDDADGTETL